MTVRIYLARDHSIPLTPARKDSQKGGKVRFHLLRYAMDDVVTSIFQTKEDIKNQNASSLTRDGYSRDST
jgi:hypothetical protein